MSGTNLTAVAYIVKKRYLDRKPENVANRKRWWLDRIKKKPKFTGKDKTISLTYGNPQAVSASFTKAKANAAADSAKGVAFTITRRRQYAFATIDAETIAATEDNEGAFVEAVTNEMDGKRAELMRRASIHGYGNGSGSIGKIAAGGIAGLVITLATPRDTRNFSVGQYLQASATETGGAVRAGNAMKVTAVDRRNGKITVDATVGGLAPADFLYNDGDYDLAIHGLAAWIPTTDPTGVDFTGVDRSVDRVLLAGHVIDATSIGLEEGLMTLASDIQEFGGDPDAAVCSPTNWTNLSKKLGSKTERSQGGKAVIGFSYIEISTAGGVVRLYSDPDCPPSVAYVLQTDTWTRHHLRDFPHVVMDDGLKSIRQTDDDGIEVRWRYWAEDACTAPAYNGVLKLA